MNILFVMKNPKTPFNIKVSLKGGDQPLLNTGNADRELLFKKGCLFSFLQNGSIKSGSTDKVNLLQDIEIHNHYFNDFSMNGPFKWTQDFLDKEIEKDYPYNQVR